MHETSSSRIAGILLVLTMGLGANCGDSPVAPRPSDRPFLVGLDVVGKTRLSVIGETSQLQAIARMSDGTSNDVTSGVSWTMLESTVVSVSPGGLVEAFALGIGTVRVTYGLSRLNIKITVTPEGTFVVAGRVRQPAASGLSSVLISEPVSGQSTTSNTDGEFTLAALLDRDLRLTRDHYEPVTATVIPFDDQVSIPMQPVMQLKAGDKLSGIVAPNDLDYDVMPGLSCGVCRMVRVQSDSAGLLHVTLTSQPTHVMNIWVNGQEFTSTSSTSTDVEATFHVDAGETIIYVGTASTDRHINFQLATVFQAS